MFSHVQFSTRVIFGFAILLSNHVFCQPCRHFRVDIFSVISIFSSLAHSILLESTTTISSLCINHQLRCCNPAVVRLLTAPKIPALLPQSLGLHCSPDSHFSPQTLLARLTAARWPSSSLTIRPHLRATHCPVRAIVDSQHRLHPHHRPSCILRAPHPSETHACRLPTLSSRSLPPSALQPRLYGASHLKSPSAITASSTTSRRPRVHPAPHHRLLVSALFAASFASSTSYASLSSAAIAGHSRAR